MPKYYFVVQAASMVDAWEAIAGGFPGSRDRGVTLDCSIPDHWPDIDLTAGAWAVDPSRPPVSTKGNR